MADLHGCMAQATHLGKVVLPSAIVDAHPLAGRHVNGAQPLFPFRLTSACGKSEVSPLFNFTSLLIVGGGQLRSFRLKSA